MQDTKESDSLFFLNIFVRSKFCVSKEEEHAHTIFVSRSSDQEKLVVSLRKKEHALTCCLSKEEGVRLRGGRN